MMPHPPWGESHSGRMTAASPRRIGPRHSGPSNSGWASAAAPISCSAAAARSGQSPGECARSNGSEVALSSAASSQRRSTELRGRPSGLSCVTRCGSSGARRAAWQRSARQRAPKGPAELPASASCAAPSSPASSSAGSSKHNANARNAPTVLAFGAVGGVAFSDGPRAFTPVPPRATSWGRSRSAAAGETDPKRRAWCSAQDPPRACAACSSRKRSPSPAVISSPTARKGGDSVASVAGEPCRAACIDSRCSGPAAQASTSSSASCAGTAWSSGSTSSAPREPGTSAAPPLWSVRRQQLEARVLDCNVEHRRFASGRRRQSRSATRSAERRAGGAGCNASVALSGSIQSVAAQAATARRERGPRQPLRCVRAEQCGGGEMRTAARGSSARGRRRAAVRTAAPAASNHRRRQARRQRQVARTREEARSALATAQALTSPSPPERVRAVRGLHVQRAPPASRRRRAAAATAARGAPPVAVMACRAPRPSPRCVAETLPAQRAAEVRVAASSTAAASTRARVCAGAQRAAVRRWAPARRTRPTRTERWALGHCCHEQLQRRLARQG